MLGVCHRSSVWTLHGNSVVIATIYHRSSVWTLHGNSVVIAAIYHSVVYGHCTGWVGKLRPSIVVVVYGHGMEIIG